MRQALAYAAKFATALVAVAGIALSQGLIEGTAAKWAAIGIAFAGALGVYIVPNAGTPAMSTTIATAPSVPPPEAVA